MRGGEGFDTWPMDYMQDSSAVGCRGCLGTREEQGSVLPALKCCVIRSKETLHNCIMAVTTATRQQAAPTSQQKKKRGDRKGQSNDSPETADRRLIRHPRSPVWETRQDRFQTSVGVDLTQADDTILERIEPTTKTGNRVYYYFRCFLQFC